MVSTCGWQWHGLQCTRSLFLEEAKWVCLGQQQSYSVFGGPVFGTPYKGSQSPPPSPLQPLIQFPFCFLSSLAFEETFNWRKVNVLSEKQDEADRPSCSPGGSPLGPQRSDPNSQLPLTYDFTSWNSTESATSGAARNQVPRPLTWCIFITSWALTMGQMLHSQVISY